MTVFMVGYMGSGKTSIGRELAKAAGFRFADTDRMVEEKCGMAIPDIFASGGGEAFFRKCEREVLESLKNTGGNVVVATGGGMPCFEDNMEVMNEMGMTVYLKMSPPKLVSRLEHGRNKRPIIRGMDDGQLLAFIEKNLVEREPFYSLAAVVIDCDGRSDEYIVNHCVEIIGRLENKTGGEPL